MNERLEEAIRLCREGRSVIKLSPRTKIPPEGFALRTYMYERRATEKELTQWWEENPALNVGVATGKISGL